MPSWSETLAHLREGDIEARDRVVRLIIGSLRSFGAYAQRESWDDVVQDVLLTLLEHAPRASDDQAVAAFIRRATRNCYVDRIRKELGRRRVRGEASASWRRNVPLDEAALEDSEGLDQRLQRDLARALEALPPRLQGILEHKYALGCTDAEGAERAGEALGTYKRLLRKALADLRAEIGIESKARRVPSEEA